jgi:hypothetical protein
MNGNVRVGYVLERRRCRAIGTRGRDERSERGDDELVILGLGQVHG